MDERVLARLQALRRHLDGHHGPQVDAATQLVVHPTSAPLGVPPCAIACTFHCCAA